MKIYYQYMRENEYEAQGEEPCGRQKGKWSIDSILLQCKVIGLLK